MATHKKVQNELLPYLFARCYQSNCSRAGDCLHYLYAKETKPNNGAYICYLPDKPTIGADCREFVSTETVPAPIGFRKGISRVPYGSAREVKTKIQHTLQISQATFYRLRKGEIPLTKEQTKALTKIFGSYGLEEHDIYDAYTEVYDVPS